MRVARMPHIYLETRNENGRITQRAVYERRWPKDVVPVLGRRFIHKWPVGVSRAQAGDDPSVPTEFKRRVEEARARLAEPERGDIMITVFDPNSALGAEYDERDQDEWLRQFRVTKHEMRRRGPTIAATNDDLTDPETAIKLWKGERIAAGNNPDDKAISAKRSKMRELFEWLRTKHRFVGEDMAAVTLGLLNQYKEHLIARGQAEDTPTLTHEHLHEIKFLYKVADRNPGLHGPRFPKGNPAEKLHIPGKPEHTPTKQFEDKEARDILVDARLSDNPLVRWGHWLAFHGCITSEIIAARKAEFKLIDGGWVFDMTERRASEMKTGYRPRGIPLYPALIDEGFAAWVQGLPDGRIFQIDAPNGREATKASRMLVDHIRSLGIKDVEDHDGRVRAHKNFKSWRKGFCSQLEDLTTPDRSRFLSGHSAADVHAKHYLEHELKKLVTAIGGLKNPIG